MNIIVSTNHNNGIGYKNELLCKIPQDMAFFKKMTENKIVIMGRKTFESLPDRQPLINRINIVLSTQMQKTENQNIIVCKTVDEVLQKIKKYPTEDIFIIGGQEIYEQFFVYCNTIYLTKHNHTKKADRFFINIDAIRGWKKQKISQDMEYNGIKFAFYKYTSESC